MVGVIQVLMGYGSGRGRETLEQHPARGWPEDGRSSVLEAFCRGSRRACCQVMLFTVQNRMVKVTMVIILNVFHFRIS